MQRLAVGELPKASTVENGATFMPTVSTINLSHSGQPTERACQLGVSGDAARPRAPGTGHLNLAARENRHDRRSHGVILRPLATLS